jgi:hypothetical protein
VFLQHAILESGMDVGIVSAHEMIPYCELEDDMKLLCENLVFNKTPGATDDMLERTEYKWACMDATKKGLLMPRKPRGKLPKLPQKLFAYNEVEPIPATEPPLPMSEAAQNHIPDTYHNFSLTHEKIASIRAKATHLTKPKLDYVQPRDIYAESFPHFFMDAAVSVNTSPPCSQAALPSTMAAWAQ